MTSYHGYPVQFYFSVSAPGTHNIRVERPFIVFLKQEAMTAVITIQKTGWN